MKGGPGGGTDPISPADRAGGQDSLPPHLGGRGAICQGSSGRQGLELPHWKQASVYTCHWGARARSTLLKLKTQEQIISCLLSPTNGHFLMAPAGLHQSHEI